jgi:hypothetical protein
MEFNVVVVYSDNGQTARPTDRPTDRPSCTLTITTTPPALEEEVWTRYVVDDAHSERVVLSVTVGEKNNVPVVDECSSTV